MQPGPVTRAVCDWEGIVFPRKVCCTKVASHGVRFVYKPLPRFCPWIFEFLWCLLSSWLWHQIPIGLWVTVTLSLSVSLPLQFPSHSSLRHLILTFRSCSLASVDSALAWKVLLFFSVDYFNIGFSWTWLTLHFRFHFLEGWRWGQGNVNFLGMWTVHSQDSVHFYPCFDFSHHNVLCNWRGQLGRNNCITLKCFKRSPLLLLLLSIFYRLSPLISPEKTPIYLQNMITFVIYGPEWENIVNRRNRKSVIFGHMN